MHMIVLGNEGFIGKRLCSAFEREGVPFDSRPAARDETGVRDSLLPLFAAAGGDPLRIVYLLSGGGGRRDTLAGFRESVAVTAELMEALAGRNVVSLVLVGGLEIYGDTPDALLTEDSPAEPMNWRGLSQLAVERMLMLHDTASPALTVVRLPEVYSTDAGDDSPVSRFYRLVLAGKTVPLSGSGNALRDYVCADEACALITALVMRNRGLGVINAGTGDGVSELDLLGMIGRVTGKTPRAMLTGTGVEREWDIVPDISRLAAVLPEAVLTPLSERLVEFGGARREVRKARPTARLCFGKSRERCLR